MSATHSDPAAVLAQARQTRIQLARQDAATFCEYVLRDERTAQPIELAPMHEQFHQLINKHRRLVLHSFIESGKSAQITIGRTLFELGRDQNLRVAIVSNTTRQAAKFLGSVARYIKASAELREVFPHLVPGDIWRTDAITVARPTVSKDPSVQAIGVHGNILGARLDLIICDDLLDYENTRTQEQREQVVAWFLSTLVGRLTEHGRVIVLGTAWHPDDLMHRLARNPGWSAHRFAIEDDQGRPRWPSRWSAARIAEKRQELGPLEAARQLDCMARSDEDARFKAEWLANALARGRGRRLLPYLLNTPAGCFVTCGVDLAVSKRDNADLTAMTTLLVHPNGDRELIALESGRWDAGEIVRRIHRLSERWGAALANIVVESNAAQMYVAQWVRRLSASPIMAYTTGRGTTSLTWQCEALATEFSNGKVILPSGADGEDVEPEVDALVRDLLYYSPKEHTPDRVASLCFARVGAERAGMRVETGRLDILGR